MWEDLGENFGVGDFLAPIEIPLEKRLQSIALLFDEFGCLLLVQLLLRCPASQVDLVVACRCDDGPFDIIIALRQVFQLEGKVS